MHFKNHKYIRINNTNLKRNHIQQFDLNARAVKKFIFYNFETCVASQSAWC